jgi:hypothetical protein
VPIEASGLALATAVTTAREGGVAAQVVRLPSIEVLPTLGFGAAADSRAIHSRAPAT